MANLHPELVSRARQLSFDNPEDLVSVYSLNDDTCLFASPSHFEIMGYPYPDMLGQNWKTFVAGQDHQHAALAGADAILMGSSIEFSLLILSKSGELVPVRANTWTENDPETGWKFLFFQARPRNHNSLHIDSDRHLAHNPRHDPKPGTSSRSRKTGSRPSR